MHRTDPWPEGVPLETGVSGDFTLFPAGVRCEWRGVEGPVVTTATYWPTTVLMLLGAAGVLLSGALVLRTRRRVA